MTLLIRRAELLDGRIVDVRLEGARIARIGRDLPRDGVPELDAAAGLLLPGLHDHHLHLAAMAAAQASVRCGPPEVEDEEALAAALRRPGDGWLRATGYHEGVAGPIDRDWLDGVVPDRPVRMQHRSGRLWIFNSAGLDLLLSSGLATPAGLERHEGRLTGRLYDEDAWVRRALKGAFPSLRQVGRDLARLGVTGVSDMSPANDAASSRFFGEERRSSRLPQHVVMAGRLHLGDLLDVDVRLGPVKLHLHEARLPEFDETVATLAMAHAASRVVAIHCVSEVELVFALAALREAGAAPGDRIEHASVAPDTLVEQMAELGLSVVAQPNFVAERGEAYRADIPRSDWPRLYRLRAFKAAGVVLAGGSDAPFGAPDPWAAMAAAVSRRTLAGRPLGLDEALTPDEALQLFLADPVDLGKVRQVAEGAPADLCLLSHSWRVARERLSADDVRATFINGRLVHDSVDEAPTERRLHADAPA